jgi:peptidoglycan/LPS O-acetylase OafA/YrhL
VKPIKPQRAESGNPNIATTVPPRSVKTTTFRPDIEGMRAIAVGLVLLFHAYGRPFTGGYIGVDVFFVVSGFLITGLLLNEHTRSGRISISRFYARRVRRILPASTVLVVATVLATYLWLGFIAGNAAANDAKWTAVFAANFRFAVLGTDYLGSQLPPSPLQHMWSLGVEEQFYVVWPGLFLLLVLLIRGSHHRKVLASVLLAIIAASFTWSIVQTSENQTWAYFSPFTRAWELGLGALVAVMTPTLAKLRPAWLPDVLAIAGLGGIILSALVLTTATRFPGSAVALPVLSTGLLIATGCAKQRTLVGRALAIRPMQWLGARSYSLYLWHWPLLVIPAQYYVRDLSPLEATGWLAVAIVAAALSYRFVENPIRRSSTLTPRTGLTLLFGLAMITTTIVVAWYQIGTHYGSWNVLDFGSF